MDDWKRIAGMRPGETVVLSGRASVHRSAGSGALVYEFDGEPVARFVKQTVAGSVIAMREPSDALAEFLNRALEHHGEVVRVSVRNGAGYIESSDPMTKPRPMHGDTWSIQGGEVYSVRIPCGPHSLPMMITD